ncbi:Uncharacterised protein [[Clostridium] sordellii]|nr:Uncharacterised protein [[Clostridium] sordellii] [Paeniclostridium sordellii]
MLIIEKNHKNPAKLTKLLCKLFYKYDKRQNNLIKENLKLTKENNDLKIKNQALEDGITRILFDSQNPNNSLNNMLLLEKSQDVFIMEELKNMFDNDLTTLEKLSSLTNLKNSNSSLGNLISLSEEKRKLDKKSKLEEEGY